MSYLNSKSFDLRLISEFFYFVPMVDYFFLQNYNCLDFHGLSMIMEKNATLRINHRQSVAGNGKEVYLLLGPMSVI